MSESKQKSKKKRCKCGKSNVSQSCKYCSRYKLVFCLKNNNDHLKNTLPNGKKVNPVWWSFLNEEKKPLNELFYSMVERAQLDIPNIFQATRIIHFYERNGSAPIHVEKLN